MVDTDTFLTILYVMVDDFCKQGLVPEHRPGPTVSLTRSEVVTSAVFGQWQGFGSERGFYRYAQQPLRGAFPLAGAGPVQSPDAPSRRGSRGVLSASRSALARPALCR